MRSRFQISMKGATAADVCEMGAALGLAPRLVRASMANFKVTWPEDFELAQRWLYQVGPSSR